ncbi:UDP-3-O-[3-hydroxymyristoyl] glucosamine N-acyltransferase [Sphingopyxis sp. YR583]|uniref:UDP-3-O-(3-hydroxymyristoyl)glucosamine N-acyltransferase n=1 Tax=Sphingopyxis sp. YR583 TaxID=1881047 RepID=UPI0008A75E6E|nr:UDP-3-O-(3-hydroxymyristoyl)glucosamine N-acyltransferase [Sphingopyxis sp. YR583]SEH18286.1 UDP-3-O-[3-hydroxymyristoyl] glucosamine N-acyltransferase [Sphingopyxis sp. YR583]
MTVQLSEILASLGELVVGVRGTPDRIITGAAALDRVATDQLTFARATGDALTDAIAKAPGAVILCSAIADEAASPPEGVTLVEVTNPRLAFIRALQRFFPPARPGAGVHPSAVVETGARIDPSASVGAHCYIGPEVVIGAGSILYPNVAIYCPTRIGANVTIHGGVVIGAAGFGYERNQSGALESFPHIGGVIIEDDAEIGSNTCIDRAALTDTVIKRGAKIDNLCHIAHNVQIGEDAAVIALSMVAGSCKIGDRAWLAPGAMVLNKVDIGVDATVGFGALVVKPVGDGETVMGVPAVDQARFRATQNALKKLVAENG